MDANSLSIPELEAIAYGTATCIGYYGKGSYFFDEACFLPVVGSFTACHFTKDQLLGVRLHSKRYPQSHAELIVYNLWLLVYDSPIFPDFLEHLGDKHISSDEFSYTVKDTCVIALSQSMDDVLVVTSPNGSHDKTFCGDLCMLLLPGCNLRWPVRASGRVCMEVYKVHFHPGSHTIERSKPSDRYQTLVCRLAPEDAVKACHLLALINPVIGILTRDTDNRSLIDKVKTFAPCYRRLNRGCATPVVLKHGIFKRPGCPQLEDEDGAVKCITPSAVYPRAIYSTPQLSSRDEPLALPNLHIVNDVYRLCPAFLTLFSMNNARVFKVVSFLHVKQVDRTPLFESHLLRMLFVFAGIPTKNTKRKLLF